MIRNDTKVQPTGRGREKEEVAGQLVAAKASNVPRALKQCQPVVVVYGVRFLRAVDVPFFVVTRVVAVQRPRGGF